MGLDPHVSSTTDIQVGVEEDGGMFFITFTYTKAKSATDITYQVQWSADLALHSWSSTGVTEENLPGEETATTLRIKAKIPIGASDERKYVRLSVTL